MVVANSPDLSANTFAARPVGAIKTERRLFFLSALIYAPKMEVFPVPAYPFRIKHPGFSSENVNATNS